MRRIEVGRVFFLGALYGCEIDFDIPILVVDQGRSSGGVLRVHVELGEPDKRRSVRVGRKKEDGIYLESSSAPSQEVLQIELSWEGKSFKSRGENLYHTFDEQLSEIKALLPEDVHIKACWTCAFSDYQPSGSGTFGNLACFRNSKADYRKVKNKSDLLQLWDRRAEYVQEIHLCAEYERRQAGIGGYVG